MATIENEGPGDKSCSRRGSVHIHRNNGRDSLFRKVSDGSLSKEGACFNSGRLNSVYNQCQDFITSIFTLDFVPHKPASIVDVQVMSG